MKSKTIVSNFIPYHIIRVWNNPKQYGIKTLSKDFTQYFQVYRIGILVFSTEDANEERVSSLIKRLQTFTDNYAFRGEMQDYEQAMKK